MKIITVLLAAVMCLLFVGCDEQKVRPVPKTIEERVRDLEHIADMERKSYGRAFCYSNPSVSIVEECYSMKEVVQALLDERGIRPVTIKGKTIPDKVIFKKVKK